MQLPNGLHKIEAIARIHGQNTAPSLFDLLVQKWKYLAVVEWTTDPVSLIEYPLKYVELNPAFLRANGGILTPLSYDGQLDLDVL